ncbi:MAG: aminotransferase class V-fold PLP-dependent enzyme [Phycisphaerales bacterium]
MPSRLYLDNAATSFPKPPGVYEAMLRYGQEVGGTAGRGTYFEAREGARIMNQCRARLCELFNGESPDHVVFTLNTTDALNLAIKGVVSARRRAEPGRPVHLITTELDHNSVLRPFNALAGRGDAEWTCLPVDETTGVVDPEALRAALRARPDTALVALTHASNVTGAIQPVAALGAICRSAGTPFLVDAAQSLGHIPVDVRATSIDLLAFPGHKGLLGPLGTGGLYLRPGLEALVDPLREGGTGSRSELDTQPDNLPDKYEPGSQNALGIAGLNEALAWHLTHAEETRLHERALTEAMLNLLREIDAWGPTSGARGLRLLGPTDPAARIGVFSLACDALSPHELAAALEQEYGIIGRAGLHCAPRAHESLGTTAAAGAYRLSIGPFVSLGDLRRVREALGEIARSEARRPTLSPA